MKKIILLIVVIGFMSCEMNLPMEKSIILGDSLVHGNTWRIDSYGINGATINKLIENLPVLTEYTDIYLLVGINNILLGDSKDVVISEMERLITLLSDKNVHIISLLPVDTNRIESTSNEYISNINISYKNIADYIDVNSSLLVNGINPYTYDGLHISPIGYKIIEDILF